MIITYNDANYEYPSSLADITLSTYIVWTDTYGKDFTEQRLALINSDSAFKEIELHMLFIDEATRALSYYTGIPYENVSNDIDVGQIVTVFNASGLIMASELREIVVQPSYSWNGQDWEINAPDLGLDGDITRQQFRAVKALAEAVIKLSEGDWSALQLLAAAYLRQPGEVFSLEYLDTEHARYIAMAQLPMDIALAIAIFMVNTMDVFKSLLTQHYTSQLPDEETPAPGDPVEFAVPPGGIPS